MADKIFSSTKIQEDRIKLLIRFLKNSFGNHKPKELDSKSSKLLYDSLKEENLMETFIKSKNITI